MAHRYIYYIFFFLGAMSFFIIMTAFVPVFAQQPFEEFSGLRETAATDNTYDTTKTNLVLTIGTVLRYVLSLLGIVMFCIMIIGFFIMNGAGGNDEEVEKAKHWIKRGFIGILIILAAYFVSIVFVYFFAGAGSGQIFTP